MVSNSPHSYGLIAIILHWLSAITVFALFAVGYWMVDLDYYSQWYKVAPDTHKSVGLILLLATLFRLLWSISQPSVRPLSDNSFERLSAKAAHKLLYLLLLLVMVSGYFISTADGRGIDVFNWFTVPSFGQLINNQEDLAGLVHEYAAYLLIGLVLLHALAALKHHFFNKDKTLIRIISITRR